MGKLAKVCDVSDCRSVGAMLEKSHTDWDVGVSDAGGGYKRVSRPDTDTPLSYVGDRYRVNNHRSQLYSIEKLVDAGELVPVSVSVWDNGEVLAYQLRAPNLDVRIRGEDMVSPLLTLAFSYGFKLADSAFFADFRWSCKNQMGQVAKLNKDSRVTHRGDTRGRFAEVLSSRIHELGTELSDRYTTMRTLGSIAMPRGRALAEYFGEAIGATKEEIDMAWVGDPKELRGKAGAIPEIVDCYEADDAGAPGTVWHAYNAVTRYETHKVGRNDATRQRRMLLGSGGDVAANAWSLAARMAA